MIKNDIKTGGWADNAEDSVKQMCKIWMTDSEQNQKEAKENQKKKKKKKKRKKKEN